MGAKIEYNVLYMLNWAKQNNSKGKSSLRKKYLIHWYNNQTDCEV